MRDAGLSPQLLERRLEELLRLRGIHGHGHSAFAVLQRLGAAPRQERVCEPQWYQKRRQADDVRPPRLFGASRGLRLCGVRRRSGASSLRPGAACAGRRRRPRVARPRPSRGRSVPPSGNPRTRRETPRHPRPPRAAPRT
jgi:hypothetical protein